MRIAVDAAAETSASTSALSDFTSDLIVLIAHAGDCHWGGGGVGVKFVTGTLGCEHDTNWQLSAGVNVSAQVCLNSFPTEQKPV